MTGDQTEFERVRTQVEKRRQEWEASGETPEGRLVKAMMWPYRDTLSDNPRSHLMVVGTNAFTPNNDNPNS